jgi:phosphatidylserine/phosphatidylglycerophosphate/cardiolipin synthase-like enzyme
MKFELPLRENTKIETKAAQSTDSGRASAQFHRTLSKPRDTLGFLASVARGATSIISSPVSLEVKDVYQRAILSAQRYIYIENQYVRASEIADWVIERLNLLDPKSNLQVIVVVPSGVEEKDKIFTPYGRYLQRQAFDRMQEAFKKKGQEANFGVFAKRSGYVHSKVLIVDDVFATIGSANANPRSFELDTESNLSWYEGASVKKLREDLWGSLLGNPKGMTDWPSSDYAKKWRTIATSKGSAIKLHDSPKGDGTLAAILPDVVV